MRHTTLRLTLCAIAACAATGLAQDAPHAKAPQIEIGLGNPPNSGKTRSQAYLRALRSDLEAALGTLDVEERRQFAGFEVAEGPDVQALLKQLADLEADVVLEAVRGAFATTRAKYKDVDVKALQESERSILFVELRAAAKRPAARVVGTEPLAIHASGLDGRPTHVQGELAPGTQLAVLRNRPEGFLTVRTPSGVFGIVDASRVLLETPIAEAGRIYAGPNGGLAFLQPKGLAVLPLEGPGHSDPVIERIREEVARGDGMSDPFGWVGIQRQIGSRSPWIAVVDLYELEPDFPRPTHATGDADEPVVGLKDKLQGQTPQKDW
ncbi:MAG: hypothetical protein KDD82_25030 [Planctomycetes bacterium]|nr:hypothetical protein [Planctomycetota bacterium]